MFFSRLLNIVFLVTFLAIGGLVVLSLPFANGLLNCYDNNVLSFDDIESSARSYGWQQFRVCELKSQSVKKLSQCVFEQQRNSSVPIQVKVAVINFLPNVRPNSQTIEFRKAQHDIECADYPSTQFDPAY